MVTEAASGGPGTNSCYWPSNTHKLVPNPVVSGLEDTVGQGDVAGQHNHCGYDDVGFLDPTTPAYIRQYGPATGVPSTCAETTYQEMPMYCDTNTNYLYTGDTLTITVNSLTVTNRRAGVCQSIAK